MHLVQVGVGGPMVLVNVVVILAVVQVGRCSLLTHGKHHLHGRRGEESKRIFTVVNSGTDFVLTIYFLVSLSYLLVLPMHGDRMARR